MLSDVLSGTMSHEDIAIEGANLISEYFGGMGQNVLLWSPLYRGLPDNTALVYDIEDFADGGTGKFKPLLRHFFSKAGIRELACVDYDDGNAPMWVMLVECRTAISLPIGAFVCTWAVRSWSVKKIQRLRRYRSRELAPIFELLVPDYPNCDLSQPLDEIILKDLAESGTRRAASNRSRCTGGRQNA